MHFPVKICYDISGVWGLPKRERKGCLWILSQDVTEMWITGKRLFLFIVDRVYNS